MAVLIIIWYLSDLYNPSKSKWLFHYVSSNLLSWTLAFPLKFSQIPTLKFRISYIRNSYAQHRRSSVSAHYLLKFRMNDIHWKSDWVAQSQLFGTLMPPAMSLLNPPSTPTPFIILLVCSVLQHSPQIRAKDWDIQNLENNHHSIFHICILQLVLPLPT